MSSKRSSASTNERLFACTNCHKRCKFEDLSSCQQLCKVSVLSVQLLSTDCTFGNLVIYKLDPFLGMCEVKNKLSSVLSQSVERLFTIQTLARTVISFTNH